jgi:cytoskeletal protein CcmA (bactofilin family)
MFRKQAGQEEPETPQQRLEAEVGVQETVIPHGTKVHGTIHGRNGVRVAGFFEGEINVEGWVWIDKQGEVQGTVKAPGVIIEGQIKGDIESSEKIEVRASGRVTGNIRCNTLAMAEGCFFQGEIKMPGEVSQPLAPVEKRQSAEDEGGPGTGD